ncbi:hypothetical protein MB901379_01961 [Mycobacterium basiliense]|uniref:Uncharacterized protein n=1 Tax=Mycobacterium basiliense TaxID=2094119 RepID=A0A447GDD0_9MYCO|nr:hypothetical protein MB901379_01961 [Mycobacterium basiliense]
MDFRALENRTREAVFRPWRGIHAGHRGGRGYTRELLPIGGLWL